MWLSCYHYHWFDWAKRYYVAFNSTFWIWKKHISLGHYVYSKMIFVLQRNAFDNYLPSFAGSYLYANEFSDLGKNENLIEGWDFVEHPTFPPPPSQTEDVEHWTRAMIIDATKKWFEFPPPNLVRIICACNGHKLHWIWFVVFQLFWIFDMQCLLNIVLTLEN